VREEMKIRGKRGEDGREERRQERRRGIGFTDEC
jgi:hypothetical protein